MESGDAPDEEASPCDPKSNNQMQKEWSKAISMLVDMETEDGLKRHVVEFWGLPPLIPLLQCVNRLGFDICSVNSCQSEQGSWIR